MCRVATLFFRLLLTIRACFFICSCLFSVLLLVWILAIDRQVLPPMTLVTHNQETNNINESHNNNASNTKYMLLWTDKTFAPFYYFTGKHVFKNNNCSYTNCFITGDRDFFGDDTSRFHAVAFNGRNLKEIEPSKVPRWPHQKFIYFNTESPSYYTFTDESFNGFFNWTSTFRLDSDIPYPYIVIKDNSGNVVGPKLDTNWIENMTVIDNEDMHKENTKIAVTFVSNCKTRSARENELSKLEKALVARGYYVDVYGACGKKKCPRGRNEKECDNIVDKYYFYLAYENSFAKDYVTEKLLRALHHNSVPVVFGGANYSRFLPPGSYLNARDYAVDNLAALMVELVKNPDRYRQYFAWKNYYTFHDAKAVQNVCSLCAALNNKTKYETPSVYEDIKAWWNE